MPKYRITAPDGNRYDITAPDGTSEEQALEYFKASYKPAAAATATTQPAVDEAAIKAARSSERFKSEFPEPQATSALVPLPSTPSGWKKHFEAMYDPRVRSPDQAAQEGGESLSSEELAQIEHEADRFQKPGFLGQLWGNVLTRPIAEFRKAFSVGKQIQTMGGAGQPATEDDWNTWRYQKLLEQWGKEHPEPLTPQNQRKQEDFIAGRSAPPELLTRLRWQFEDEVVGRERGAKPKAEQTPAALAIGGAVEGVENFIGDTLGFFTSPIGIALPGAAALPKVPKVLIGAGFLADMGRHLPEQYEQMKEAAQRGDIKEATRIGTEGVATLGMMGLIGVHTAKVALEKPLVTAADSAAANNAPATAEALRNQVVVEAPPVSAAPPPQEAPVVYRGYQEGFGEIPGYHLYNLTADLGPKLVKGSTVTEESLNKAGYTIPEIEKAKAVAPKPKASVTKPSGEVAAPTETLYYGPDGRVEVVEQGKSGNVLVRPFGQPDAPTVELKPKQIRTLTRRVRAEEPDPVEVEERKAIDEAVGENQNAGLPANVILSEEITGGADVPFARTIATVDREGNVVINQGEFRKWIEGVDPKRRPEAVKSLLSEEGIHSVARSVLSDAEAAGLWKSLSGPERALASKSYTGNTKGTRPDGTPFTDTQMGHEYIRRAIQRLMKSPVREVAESSGFGRLTERTIDIIERVIAAVKKLVGTKGSKTLNELLGRIEDSIGKKEGARPAAEGEAAAAYRKPRREEQKEELPLAPAPKDVERPGATELGALPEKTVTPAILSERITENLGSGRPNFGELVAELQKEYPKLQRGQLAEAWEDAVWRRAEAQLPKRERGPEAEALPGMEGIGKRKFEVLEYKPGEFRPEQRIATEALKLIRQAKEPGRASLYRSTVVPEDVRVSDPSGFREIRASEIAEPGFAKSLTEGGAADRTTKFREIVSEGVAKTVQRKAPKASETKRLTALLDTETGRVELVSTYADKGELRIVHPLKTHLRERPNVSIESLLSEGRYKPIASILLDEPVRNFHQRFPELATFEERVAGKVREEYEAANQIAQAPAVEGEIPATPGLRSGTPMTDTEAGAFLDFVHDELGDISTRADFDFNDITAALSDRLNTKPTTPQAVAEKNRARLAVIALDKAIGENPTEAEINSALDKLYENAAQAPDRESFVRRTVSEFGGEVETTRQPSTGGTGTGGKPAYREKAASVRFRERVVGQREESSRLEEALERGEITSPSRYVEPVASPDVNAPEAFLKPAAKKISEIAEDIIATPLRLGSEWMVDRIRRVGASLPDPVQRRRVDEAAAAMNDVVSEQRRYAGVLNDQFGDAVKKEAGKLDKANVWFNKVQEVTADAGVRNFKEAIEGRLQPSEQKAQKRLALYQDSNLALGEAAEPVSPGFLANGGMHSNLTGFGVDVIRNGFGPELDRWVRGTAAANGVPLSDARQFFRKMKRVLDDPSADAATVASIAQDFSRKFPRAITDIRIGTGLLSHWEPVIHGTPYEYFNHGIEKVASIRAFREKYPTGTPAFQQQYNALIGALPGQWHGLVNSVFRVLQGQPTESFLAPGVQAVSASKLGHPIVAGLRAMQQVAAPVLKSLQLTQQIALQPGELASGAGHIFFGFRRAASSTLARFGEDYQAMERAGVVDRMFYNDAFDPSAPGRSTARIVSNMIRRVAVENAVNEMQEAQNGMAALITAREIVDASTGGKALPPRRDRMLRKTFEFMGFSRAEVARMMLGDEQLLMQMVRKAPSWLSGGHKHPAERSRLLANRTFQGAFWYWDYPMTRLNQLVKIFETGAKDARAGRWDEVRTDARMLGRFMVGAGTQGVLTTALMTLFGAGIYGLFIRKEEAEDEPIQFAADAMKSSLGGPIQAVVDGYEDRGLWGAADNLKKIATPSPAGAAMELANAVSGKSKYRDMPFWDRMGQFLLRQTPGTKAIRAGIGAEILGRGDFANQDAAMKAFYRWRRQKFGSIDRDEPWLNEDNKKEFRTSMKEVVDALRKGDPAKVDAAIDKATDAVREQMDTELPKAGRQRPRRGEELERVRRSLESRVILKIPTGPTSTRPLTDEELSALREHIGDDPVSRLEAFDEALKSAAGLRRRR